MSTQGLRPALEGQLDAEADADAAGLAGALVGRLHRAGSAAGDHREAGVRPARGRPPRRSRRPGRPAGCGRSRSRRSPGPSSASAPKPSMNSAWIRSTRHGSVCTQSVGPRESSSRWSVVVPSTWFRRITTGPLHFGLAARPRVGHLRLPATARAHAHTRAAARAGRTPPACGPASGHRARSSRRARRGR